MNIELDADTLKLRDTSHKKDKAKLDSGKGSNTAKIRVFEPEKVFLQTKNSEHFIIYIKHLQYFTWNFHFRYFNFNSD